MAALIPVTQPPNVEAAYEDMFKEITRKLYGEETGNGLHTLGTPVAHIATSGPTAPEGERSFTTLMSDRSLATTIEYDQNGSTETSTANNFKSEDHLTTAFGLAALMQNGFTTTGTILNTHTLAKPSTNITTTATTSASNTINVVANSSAANAAGSNNEHQRWTTTTDEIISWPAGGGKLTSFNGSQKSIKVVKSRVEQNDVVYHATNATNTVVVQTGTQSSNNRKNKNSNSNQIPIPNLSQIQIQKRYSCGHCPYSTDRRDLYTRHENIHKDEKPFQCYACLKQFNRADHVKKHFLRMHRELAYDINKTRRTIVPEQKPIIFAQQPNTNNNQQGQQQQQQQQQQQPQQMANSFINSQRTSTLQDSSLSIAQTIESVATAQIAQHPQMKQEKSGDEKSPVKIKREKRFSCCYCPWSGADKWGLKRHLNTHTKPFVCMLCDYKAARSERLATHVLKVHNKKACNKCSFLAENQEEYQAHINEIHQLKMDAISRNTASVAQDFHNAGGVVQNQNYVSNNNYHYGAENFVKCELLENSPMLLNNNTTTTAGSFKKNVLNPMKMFQKKERKAMSIFYNDENQKHHHHHHQQQQQHMKSPPAYQTNFNYNNNKVNTSPFKGHRLNYLTQQDKENSNSLFTNMEYENYSPSTQFQNYVKEIINKLYYAEPPLFCADPDIRPKVIENNNHKIGANVKQEKDRHMQYDRKPKASIKKENELDYTNHNNNNIKTELNDSTVSDETRNYFEYLSNKKDITITYGNGAAISLNDEKNKPVITISTTPIAATSNSRKRKQSQPQKIIQTDIMTILRDKYLKRLVDPRKSCVKCANSAPHRHNMLVFPYHTAGSLTLHRIWRHSPAVEMCALCNMEFTRSYSYKIHWMIKHCRK